MLLLAGALVRCDCEEVEEFIPAARYVPGDVLDFGKVAVTSEKTLFVSVQSNGRAGLILSAVNRSPDDAGTQAKFKIDTRKDLLEGLTPGRTSSIAVTYRPCPAAWGADGRISDSFDFDTCPTALDQIDLVIVDNSRAGGAKITIFGQPVQAPVLEIRCPRGGMACNMPQAELSQCVSLSFGTVNAGQMPCEITVEIENKKRGGKPTGDLEVERIDVLAFSLDDPQRMVRQGSDIGFSIVGTDGQPLALPLVVPIPEGRESGSTRFKVVFNGARRGQWRGERNMNSGLRIYTNDPSQRPAAAVSLFGIGSAPDIQVLPHAINFGPVPQGSTRTATLTVQNAGDAILEISDIRFRVDQAGQKFRVRNSRGATPPIQIMPFTGTIELFVDYTPQAGGQDADSLLIASNDIADNPLDVPITGGAVPKLDIQPSDQLVFALPNPLPPPPIPPRNETIELCNVGYGDLTVQRLTITGPSADMMHPSVDDYSIVECMGQNPCTPNTVLCAPSAGNCRMACRSFTVRYQNNDNSTTDLAELHVATNDPTDPNHIVILNAQDVPCFFPTPIITVTSTSMKVGQPIRVTASSSEPGGAPGMPGMITSYTWDFLFTPGPKPMFNPPGTVNTSFVPMRHGPHVLGLHVANNCGSSSQSPATENITVQP